MIEREGGSSSTLRISNVAAALARDHGLNGDEEVRNRFFKILDAQMDKTGPDQLLVDMLKEFKRTGFNLGIVTFVRKPRIVRRLEVWRLADQFGSVITPDDVSEVKPSPEPFRVAMKQLRVQPNECFMIGDEPVDMIGGKKAGATTIGLPQGFFTKQELEKAGAYHILNSIGQLPPLVSQQNESKTTDRQRK
jgi:pyrophosphatase PpaX